MLKSKLLLVVLGVLLAIVVLAAPVLAKGPGEHGVEGRTQAGSKIIQNPQAKENVSKNNPAIGDIVSGCLDPEHAEAECK